MLVKQFLCGVMRLIGRDDAAEQCESGVPDDEVLRMQRAMLMCLNAVTDELARGYFPLRHTQTLQSEEGKYSYGDFELTPYRVRRVTSGGQRVEYTTDNLAIFCSSPSIEVEYEYVPNALTLEDEFGYPDKFVGPTLVACGVASEYMLIAGDVARAEMWESRYRAEIDRQQSLSPWRGIIPPRRWI